MAFNPFDIFRRNTRILFIILTCIMMFVFVLQFGQGDLFSMIPKLLAARTRGGEVLAVVDGRKVYSSELGDLETRRLVANEYMVRGSDRALQNLQTAVADNLKTVTAQNKQTIEKAFLAVQRNYFSQELEQRYQMLQRFNFGTPISMDDERTDRERTLQFTLFSLEQVVQAKNPPEADRTAAQALMQLIDLRERRILANGSGNKTHYFGNQPANTTRDNVEFMLWLKKADQLGIHFAAAEVSNLANHELFQKMTADDWRAVDGSLRDKARYTPSMVQSALADEFRVRSAQAAVMGQSALNPLATEYQSPAEAFEFFRKETNPATYRVIAVPAENFLDRVTGSPDDGARRELFQAGKNDDPNPKSPKFGLREPRKLKLGWLEVTGEEPYFKAAAAEAAPKLDLAAKLSGFLVAPLPGVSLTTLLAAPAPAFTPNLLTGELYRAYVATHKSGLSQSWFSVFGGQSLPDPAFVRPAHVATLAAGLAGAFAGQGGPFAAPSAFVGAAVLADRKTRFETLPTAVIAPLSPGLGGLVTAIGNLAVQNVAAQPLPQATVQGRLLSQFEEKLVKTVAVTDIVKLITDLDKLKPAADSPEAKKLVADFAAARGLKVGGSKEFRDQYGIGSDEGLKVLVAKKEESNPLHSAAEVTPAKFGRRFFFEQTRGPDGSPGREVPSSGFFRPQPYPNEAFPIHLVYRTQEQSPEPLRDPNSAEAKAKVEAAWRRKQARELARKAAEGLAAQARTLGGNAIELGPKLTQLHTDFAKTFASPEAQARVKSFTLDDVAPVVETSGIGIMAQRGAGGYSMKETADIAFPTQAMVEEVVRAKDKPLGTALVLTDEPGDVAYVAVLADRQNKSVDDFFTYVYSSLAKFTPLQPIVKRNQRAALRKQARDTAVLLLKSEFGYEKESESLNKKSIDD